MRDGTGLKDFSENFPSRFFDVGIAEQHAVTLAAGMAQGGLRPVFAVYSTFLQRAYDQVIHDVCQQNLPVVFAIDRAGIVGNDGETHQGVFDISFLSHMPNLTIMAPKVMDEMKIMFEWAFKQNGPVAIRYPRGGDNTKLNLVPQNNFSKGKWEKLSDEGEIAIIATGKMVGVALEVKEKAKEFNIHITVINACFIKPIDKKLLNELIAKDYKIITIEDNVVHGGLGSIILEYVNSVGKNIKILNMGFEDKFIPHGEPDVLYKLNGLDVDSVIKSIVNIM